MAYACSCMQPLSPDEELPNYDVVFSGTAREIGKENPLSNGDFSSDSVYVTFDVDREWKGFKADNLIIKTPESSAACGFPFEENQEYVVYATHSEEFPFELLEANMCSRTGLLSGAFEEFDELGPGVSVKPEIKPPTSLSPLKQFNSGIPAGQIQCKEELHRVLKYDGSPVCVKSKSIGELNKRGFINIPITSVGPEYDLDEEMYESSISPKWHKIPVHVYEVWDSQGIIIHGDVDKPKEDTEKHVVKIQIKDQHGNIIDTDNVLPYDSGKFVKGTTKFIPRMAEIDPRWENITSYDVSAFYKYPDLSVNENNITLDKNTIPLNSRQISNLSHNEIINIISEWNKIDGVVPFTVLSVIGVEDRYELGDPVHFAVQKSGYGNPCPNQSVVIFNENTKEHVRTDLYLEICNADQEDEITEPYDYLIPYNMDRFMEMPPITKPGDYVMVIRSDNNSKHIERFTVFDSDHTFEYKLAYSMQRDSTSNKGTMEINLTDGEMLIENLEDRTITETILDSETLEQLNSEIVKNNFVANPFTNEVYGDFCDTCNLGEIALYIDDVLAHHIAWDDRSLGDSISEFERGSPEDNEFSSYFSLVDCIASKNNFDTYWISDSASSEKKYAESEQNCSELVEESSGIDSLFMGQDPDYDFLVNNDKKPVSYTTSSPPNAGSLADAHEHASILVRIFGDKFEFSRPEYQIKSPWIHFEGNEGSTIHRHSTGVTLGYLFDSIGLHVDEKCYIFPNNREFCTNDEYSLKFFINGQQVESITDYVILQDDRILISYGEETQEEIEEQIEELNLQGIVG